MTRSLPILVSLLGAVAAQSVGQAPEVHPKLTTWTCTKADGCKPKTSALVLDSLAHPVHQKDDPSKGCGNWGSGPDPTVCPDAVTCQENCIVEGVSDYSQYGVTTDGGVLTMKLLRDDGTVASPRIYLLDETETKYEMLQLTGREFTFDVDVSKLPCGMNGALYLSEMKADGGANELNTGGAAYGSGYCDAQCYVTPFINGVANLEKIAPHPCNQTSFYGCSGDECTWDGVCDQWGCGFNTYVNDVKGFYGPGPEFTVDTTKPFSVVTQFPADPETGDLVEIRRIYVQDGKVIPQATVNITGPPEINFINQDYCEKTSATRYNDLGGTKEMGEALSRGMVLAMSIWWDEGGFMSWLDGGNAGPCNATEGDPKVVLQVEKDPTVIFSNVKWGELDSTYQSKPPSCKRRKA